MHIQLTDQERRLAEQGQPVDVIDPQTSQPYVLIARHRFEQLNGSPDPSAEKAGPVADAVHDQIPEGIRLSQEAYRRDLPELLKQKKLCRQWVAYQGDRRLGIADTGHELRKLCDKRGLHPGEYYLGWIDPCGLEVEEELEPRLHHYEGFDDDDP